MDGQNGWTRAKVAWTVLRLVVLALLAVTVGLMVLFVGMVVASATGLSFDPHGYTRIVGVMFTVYASPVALGLWLLHRWLRRRSKGPAPRP